MFKFYLHGNSFIPALLHGEKKVKDLVVGDKVLCSHHNDLIVTSLLDISSEEYSNWSKVTLSDDSEIILDRSIPLELNKTFLSLNDKEVKVVSIKDYNKTSKAYKIKLEDSFDDIYINDIPLNGFIDND